MSMALAPGTRLGPYDIVAALGAGGMGEVYRARDTRLGREVALKTLPAEVSSDPERMARFENEARTLAVLNHPNIAQVHGFERFDGVAVLAMELVEGNGLDDLIRSGSGLPLRDALAMATQIANALEAAHDCAIVHRDLKPANVKVRPDGTVKVLDFGLAKALGREAGSGTDQGIASNSPTITSPAQMTRAGIILGTAAYMSPEQARGRAVDKRADIWAFGAVLFEMLARRRPFGGRDVTETLAFVLMRDPDWDALPDTTPPVLRRLLVRCLQKDPGKRLRDIGDARLEIEDAMHASADTVPAARSAARGFWPMAGWITAAAAIAVAAWSLTRIPSANTTAPANAQRFTIALPTDRPVTLTRHALLGVGRRSLAISPDGRTLVYVADTGSGPQLYVRPIDSFDARPIAGTEGGLQPFFSPDGRWIAFFAKDKLKKVLIAGGEPTILADARTPFGGTWTANDMIVFSHAEGVLMMRVPASGGAAEQVAAFHPNRGFSPAALPDGTAVLMDFFSETGARQVALLALDTGARTVLIEDGTGALYSDTGHLVFMRGSTLMAVPFDVSTRLISGSAEVVLQGIRRERTGTGQLAFSRTGTLIYIAGGDDSLASLGWVDRNGGFEALALPAQLYGTFRIAPDGRRLAFGVQNPLSDIWLYDFERKAATRLTTTGSNWLPSWTAAGRVAYASIRQSAQAVYLSSVDGTATEERLIAGPYTPDSWSAGDRYVAMEDRTKGWDIVTMAIGAGERKPEPFLSTTSAEWGPAFSPDGRYLAYTSDEDGGYQVYVRPFPKTDRKWQVSIDGGEEPVWSRDGRELFYRNGQQWMVADIPRSPEFSSSRPRLLFEGPYGNVAGLSYDVSPDAKRFIVIKPSDVAETASELRVILNWHEELRRRLAPASR